MIGNVFAQSYSRHGDKTAFVAIQFKKIIGFIGITVNIIYFVDLLMLLDLFWREKRLLALVAGVFRIIKAAVMPFHMIVHRHQNFG